MFETSFSKDVFFCLITIFRILNAIGIRTFTRIHLDTGAVQRGSTEARRVCNICSNWRCCDPVLCGTVFFDGCGAGRASVAGSATSQGVSATVRAGRLFLSLSSPCFLGCIAPHLLATLMSSPLSRFPRFSPSPLLSFLFFVLACYCPCHEFWLWSDGVCHPWPRKVQ